MSSDIRSSGSKTPTLVKSTDQQQRTRKGLRSLAAKLSRLVGEGRHASRASSRPRGIGANRAAGSSSSSSAAWAEKFDPDEQQILRKIYVELCGEGNESEGMDKVTFLQYFPLPGLWGERLFAKFDTRKRNKVDWDELMRGLALCCRGTKTERIGVLFEIFNLHNDQKVSREELTLLLSNIPHIRTYFPDITRPNPNAPNPPVSRTQSRSLVPPVVPIGIISDHEKLASSSVDQKGGSTTSRFGPEGTSVLARWTTSSVSSLNSSSAAPLLPPTIEWPHLEGAGGEDEGWKSYGGSDMDGVESDKLASPEEDEEYLQGAGPSPMISELLARVQKDAELEVEINDLEGIVSSIMDDYDAAGADALNFDDFKSFVERHPKFLKLLSDCLRENVWSTQGHALFRSQHPTKPIHNPLDGLHQQPAEMERLEKWIKIQQLFMGRAAPRQVSHVSITEPPGDQNVMPSTSIEVLPPEPDTIASSKSGIILGPVYPKYSRYAGSREVLEFLESSLGQFSPDDEDSVSASGVPEGAYGLGQSERTAVERETLWQDRGGTLSCPHCLAPLLVCPTCDSRFPILRMRDDDTVIVECQKCSDENPKEYSACWICQWQFDNAASELIDQQEVRLEGSLWKIGKTSKVWTKRYFVLMDKLLYYYIGSKDTIPKGFIFLEGCFVDPISTTADLSPRAESDDSADEVFLAEGHRKFGFCLVHAVGTLGRREFFAQDEAARDRWVLALRVALSQQPIDQLYDLQEVIGHGKFSLVYRATEKSTGEDYAVKVVNKQRMTPHEKDLLRGEMSIMRLLRHPNVIYLKTLVATKEALHIVMELVPGGELFDAISQKGPLPEMTVHRLSNQILKTLVYLHRAGICHRDLKPENVLLTSRNPDEADIKIADFGLSCLCGPNEKLYQPCGTLVYVAPEVLTLQGYNHQVDLWSLGVMIYLMLSGRLPFPISMRTPGVAVLTDREKFYTPRCDAPVWRTISRSAQDFVRKLLTIDPEKRITGPDALNHIWIKNPTAVMKDAGTAKASPTTAPANGGATDDEPEPPQHEEQVLVRTATDEDEQVKDS